MMLEWPGRCSRCKEAIADWAEAGSYGGRWIHKSCWSERLRERLNEAGQPPALLSPVERSRQLEWPMLFFLLLFHFGLGGAVAGWIMLTQGGHDSAAYIVLTVGIVAPLIGVAGVAVNIVSRRRIELIRQRLELQGGWKPGR